MGDRPRKRRPGLVSYLPQRVIFDRELTAQAKVLFAEILALSETDGYCWASNQYLARLFDASEATVSRQVAQLTARGYIESRMEPTATGSERHIFVTDLAFMLLRPRGEIDAGGVRKNEDTPLRKNEERGVRKNAEGGLRKNADQSINNKYLEIPPYSPPKGGRARRDEHKDKPDWAPEAFEKLWQWYPGDPARHAKRGNRQRAIRAWDKLHPTPELIDTIADALARQAESDEWAEGVGIPHLSTYLNGYGWEGWESAGG